MASRALGSVREGKNRNFFVSERDRERPAAAEHLAAASGCPSCLAAAASCGARQLLSGAAGGCGCGSPSVARLECHVGKTGCQNHSRGLFVRFYKV